MNPRKSSTSSGKPSGLRPRYLGIELEGAGEPLPALSVHAWELLLADRLASAGIVPRRFRVVRSEGRRAIAEVDQWTAPRARVAWAAPAPGGPARPVLRPFRTWGTLVEAKVWLLRNEARGR